MEIFYSALFHCESLSPETAVGTAESPNILLLGDRDNQLLSIIPPLPSTHPQVERVGLIHRHQSWPIDSN